MIASESPVYLDNNSTTPVHQSVFRAMEPYLRANYGNPSSIWHTPGRRALQAVETARARVADLVGCAPTQVIFTSGGSEANTQALLGACQDTPKARIVSTPIEHDSVRRSLAFARRGGAKVDLLGVGANGVVCLKALDRILSRGASLISIMWVNNETGVIQPIEDAVALASKHGVPVHVDAVQALGRVCIDIPSSQIDLMTLSSHKIQGPKGVGALIARDRKWVHPRILGGHQEYGLRAGTENVAGIVGFGTACELLKGCWQEARERIQGLRRRFEQRLTTRFPQAVVFGDEAPRVCNTTLVAWPGLEARVLLRALDRVGIFAASGSACTSVSTEPSHVLTAMGIAPGLASCAVRFSLGLETTGADIETTLEIVERVVAERIPRHPGTFLGQSRSSH